MNPRLIIPALVAAACTMGAFSQAANAGGFKVPTFKDMGKAVEKTGQDVRKAA
jgi:hypothetical protein